jgi:hypothetical protein
MANNTTGPDRAESGIIGGDRGTERPEELDRDRGMDRDLDDDERNQDVERNKQDERGRGGRGEDETL